MLHCDNNLFKNFLTCQSNYRNLGSKMYLFLLSILWTITAFILFYQITTQKFNYWKHKMVPYPKPLPLFGNYFEYIIMKKCQAKVTQELCRQFPKEPYFGTFFGTEPALMIQDPEIIKHVFTKDFYYFNSRELMDYIYKEVITQNLFFQFGDKWKVIRSNLTPIFTSAKMKNMFHLIEKCAHTFENMLDYETNLSDSGVLAIRTMMIRYTMDAICSCSFGIETGTMDKDAEKNPFTIMGRLIMGSSYYRGFKTITRQLWPKLFYGIGLKTFPTKIEHFFYTLLTGVFKSRGYKPSQRKDFVDLLLNLKKNEIIVGDSISNMKTGGSKKVALKMDDDLMVSQCVIFFAAGFETSADAMGLTIYELAKNVKAQRRAQKEIDEYLQKHDNKVSISCTTELPFLEACVSETLRIYPPLPVITREVAEEYTFPSGLHLEKGLRVHLPVYHLHRDPKYFPDPEEYKPERFLTKAKQEIKPFTYFPFGEGPRTCIGMRFSKMLIMPGLITFLKTYSVELAPETPRTLEFENTTLLLQPASELPVKVTKRRGWEKRVYTK